jgi:hypothetical protein
MEHIARAAVNHSREMLLRVMTAAHAKKNGDPVRKSPFQER